MQKIRDCSDIDKWFHVKTADNPADLVSRGCTGRELLNSMWFSGPSFLLNSQIDYVHDDVTNEELPVAEIKHGSCLASTVIEDPLQHFQKFSSWTCILGIIATCFRFIDNMRTDNPY